MSLIEAALGEAFARLPPVLRAAHIGTREIVLDGVTDIDRAKGFPSGWVAGLFGYPPSGRALPTRILLTPTSYGEAWSRTFGTRTMVTHLSPAPDGRFFERFGPVDFVMALEPIPDGFTLRVLGWRFLRVPLPKGLQPRVAAHITGEAEDYLFDIAISAPVFGHLVRYRGRLTVASGGSSGSDTHADRTCRRGRTAWASPPLRGPGDP